jgi:CRP/FNR family transcriptional regulator, cyclic AMP receptor protein
MSTRASRICRGRAPEAGPTVVPGANMTGSRPVNRPCPAASPSLSMPKSSDMGPMMKHDTGFGVLTGNNIDTRFFKAGTTIFREGDEAHELYVIKSGEVRIQIGNRTVSEFSADHVFGEMALIDNEPRSASAIAVTDVELVPVSEKQFLFLVSQTPYFALKVMRVLAQRLRVTNKTLG